MMTVKGKALPFAWMYRIFAKDFKVYVFSRKNELEKGCTIHDMARDLNIAMKGLGIKKADIMGVSQGGMIAEYFTLDYPEKVNKLVLVVTIGKQNDCIQKAVKKWIKMARQRQYGKLMQDITIHMYTEEYLKKYPFIVPLFGLYPPPKNERRFLRMAKSCIMHDAYDCLDQIKVPTLIIGGAKDTTVGSNASRELAERIEGSELYIYQEYGHGLYSEAKDFNQRVYSFLKKV